MVKKNKIPPRVSVYIRYLYQDANVKGRALLRRFPQYSKASIYRHACKPIEEDPIDHRHSNKGRPPVLDDRDKRAILREMPKLRSNRGAFTVKKLMNECGIVDQASRRTVSRFLNKRGYRYLHSRKKGLMTKLDLKKRVKFARNVQRHNPKLWTEGISFYLDGVGFVHKTNPRDEAMAPKGMAWRQRSEGLEPGYTAKGKKEGVNGRVAKYIVCISYKKGVICCEKYEKMNGEYFKSFIETQFGNIFQRSNSPNVKRFLQDGDPSQNSALCKATLDKMGVTIFPIPPRSPDINPIENLFNNVKVKLDEDAIRNNIKQESYEEFCNRVEATLLNFNKDIIDKTILSMETRMDLIVKRGGKRLKY